MNRRGFLDRILIATGLLKLRHVCVYAATIEDSRVVNRAGLYLNMQGADRMAAFLGLKPLLKRRGTMVFVISDSSSGREYDGEALAQCGRDALVQKRNKVSGFLTYEDDGLLWG